MFYFKQTVDKKFALYIFKQDYSKLLILQFLTSLIDALSMKIFSLIFDTSLYKK